MDKRIWKLACDFKPEMIRFCQRLIRTPALSGQEAAIATLYVEEMKRLGYDQAFIDDYGNVIGIIKAAKEGASVLFNGHLDHVKPGKIKDDHSYKPFEAVMDETSVFKRNSADREYAQVIYGAGAADVKGGGAALIYAGAVLLALRKRKLLKEGQFIFSMTVMEEYGDMTGMVHLMDETFDKENIHPIACISCEATGGSLYLGHRGKIEIHVTTEVSNPIFLVEQLNEILKKEPVADPYLGVSSLTRTAADGKKLVLDWKLMPGQTPETCIMQIRKAAAILGEKVQIRLGKAKRVSHTGMTASCENWKAGWRLPKSHWLCRSCNNALLKLGQTPEYGYWSSGTDLSYVHVQHQIPSIGYSPMQEFYCHKSIELVRTDYMLQAMAGYASIFLELNLEEGKG